MVSADEGLLKKSGGSRPAKRRSLASCAGWQGLPDPGIMG